MRLVLAVGTFLLPCADLGDACPDPLGWLRAHLVDWSDSLQPITGICILYGSNSGLTVKVSVMAGACVMEVVKNQTEHFCTL